MHRSRLPVAVVAVAAVLVLGGCSDDGGTVRDGASGSASPSGSGSASGFGEVVGADFTLGDADTVVDVQALEYRFRVEPIVAPGPQVFFHLRNRGEDAHELEVVDARGAVVAELPPTVAGRAGALAAELAAGDYVLRCRLESPDGRTHESRGMRVNVKVT